jgi:hypothetical protein
MLDWDAIAPMIVGVVFFLTVGGVIILRPIAKQLGGLLEAMAQEKQSGLQNDVSQIRDLLETMNGRLQLLEERQDFTERVLAGPRKRDELKEGL